MTEYVWYASYGSNISTERFLCYITGGQAKGALTSEEGCRDNSMPIDSKTISISRKQYYAKAAKRWQNQGVAFLESIPSTEATYGKMYLITKEQFEDVVKQENALTVDTILDIKLEEAEEQGSAVVTKGWYGRIMYLGCENGYPIYTFTNIKRLEDEVLNEPSREYILMIASGLIENYNMSLEDLTHYFYNKTGVSLGYSKKEVKNILNLLFI